MSLLFLAAAATLGKPDAPQLSYTAQGQFTITNYNASLTYALSGATRTDDIISSVTNGATITAAYATGAPVSGASVMNVLAGARVLTDSIGLTDTGCGERGNICCPGGRIQTTAGNACGGAPGSLAPDGFCDTGGGAPCPGNCYQLTVACHNWYWTNYTAEGYTLFGGDSGTWGKATNA